MCAAQLSLVVWRQICCKMHELVDLMWESESEESDWFRRLNSTVFIQNHSFKHAAQSASQPYQGENEHQTVVHDGYGNALMDRAQCGLSGHTVVPVELQPVGDALGLPGSPDELHDGEEPPVALLLLLWHQHEEEAEAGLHQATAPGRLVAVTRNTPSSSWLNGAVWYSRITAPHILFLVRCLVEKIYADIFTLMFTFENLDWPGSRVSRRIVQHVVSQPFTYPDERPVVMHHYFLILFTKSTTNICKDKRKQHTFA